MSCPQAPRINLPGPLVRAFPHLAHPTPAILPGRCYKSITPRVFQEPTTGTYYRDPVLQPSRPAAELVAINPFPYASGNLDQLIGGWAISAEGERRWSFWAGLLGGRR